MFRLRIIFFLATGVCLAALFSVLTYSYYRVQRYALLPKLVTQKGEDLCNRWVTKNSISALSDNRSFIITPYFDDRVEKQTRVIGIVHHKEVKDHYCWFCCPADSVAFISKAAIEIHSDRFGFPYAVADLICLEPSHCEPHYVALQSSGKGSDSGMSPLFEIKNRQRQSTLVDFTVCISTMFGNYNNVLQFVQSIEMYKLLGAQKVVIYKNSCSQLMEKVLQFYVVEGTVEVVPWPITSYLNVSKNWYFTNDGTKIGYYGQITALNDCVYRNMYSSRYVLLNDIDEIILPIKYWDWETLMQNLEKQNPKIGIFLFENHIFPKNVFPSPPDHFPHSWNIVPGVNILQHVFREPSKKRVANARKMIVDPRKVVQTSVHSVLQGIGGSVQVPADIAIVFHCRHSLQPGLPREFLIKDTTLWKYNMSLIGRVNKVLQNIPFEVVK